MTRIAAALCVAGAILALPAAPAVAAPRYVSPTGSGVACSEEAPCGLERGVEFAADGDEVIVAPGNYGTPATPLGDGIFGTADIDVHGVDGQPRPMLYSSAPVGFQLNNAGATLTHFGVVTSNATGPR